MKRDAINEAAEKEYPLENCIDDSEMAQAYIDLQTGFTKGALSDAAKQYWFEVFRKEEMARIKSVINSMPSDADLMEDSKI